MQVRSLFIVSRSWTRSHFGNYGDGSLNVTGEDFQHYFGLPEHNFMQHIILSTRQYIF